MPVFARPLQPTSKVVKYSWSLTKLSMVAPVSSLLAVKMPGLQVKSAIGGIDQGHRAKAAQRRGDGGAGREILVQELAVVVEERVGVDEVRRKQLADGILESIAEQALPNVELSDAEIEIAPGCGGRHDVAGQHPALQRWLRCTYWPARLNSDIKAQCVWRACVQDVFRQVEGQLVTCRVGHARQRIRVVLIQEPQRSAER